MSRKNTMVSALFLASVISEPALAQGIDLGFLTGVTSSTVSVVDVADSVHSYGRNLGFLAEGHLEWAASNFLALTGAVGYHQRGYEEAYRYRDAFNRIHMRRDNTRFDYLSLSAGLMLRYPGSVVQPFVSLRPRADILFHRALGSVQVDQEVGDNDTAIDSWLGSHYKSVAFGYLAGVGLDTKVMGPLVLRTEVRYGRDFTDNFDWNYDEISEVSASNDFVDFLIGVKF